MVVENIPNSIKLPRVEPNNRNRAESSHDRVISDFSRSIGIGDIEMDGLGTDTPSTRRVNNLMKLARIEQFKQEKWFCCSRTSPNFVKYIVQVSFSCVVMGFSITMLATNQENREIYLNLLMLIIGIFIQNPKIEND